MALGVIFDNKLQWGPQVSQTITKAKRALNANKLIKPYFNTEELRKLLTSNYFSILFYNLEIWHIPSFKAYLKQQLLTASAAGLKLCTVGDTSIIWYKNLQLQNKWATPNQCMIYKHS